MRKQILGLAILVAALLTPYAHAEETVQFKIGGYYRMRSVLFGNLFDAKQPVAGVANYSAFGFDKPNRTTYTIQRARLEPQVSLPGKIVFKAQLDLFDNVVWGDNENLASTPLFAGTPSNTQVGGTVVPSIQAKRAWVEWSTLAGQIRVGRQPSHWGLGLIANHGDGFDDDFGDNYGGSTYDRIMYVTKPYEVIRALIGLYGPTPLDQLKGPKASNIIFGLGFDKLVESSAEQYIQKLVDIGQATGNFTNENELAENGGFRWSPLWLSDQGDDVNEVVFVVGYKPDKLKVARRKMDLFVGAYIVNRFQKETYSDVWILDAYLNWKYRGWFAKAEGYLITCPPKSGFKYAAKYEEDTGKVYDGSFCTVAITSGTPEKKVNIGGWAFRAGRTTKRYTATFEAGGASGDDIFLNSPFTGRALHPDYVVGLILYPQVLAQRTAERTGGSASFSGLWSKGGVYNSNYIFPRVKFEPSDYIDLRLGFLTAWVNKVDGAVIPYLNSAEQAAGEDSGGKVSKNRNLGIEIDASIYSMWAEDHIQFGVEAGWFHAGKRLRMAGSYPDAPVGDITQDDIDRVNRALNNIWTIQGRFIYQF